MRWTVSNSSSAVNGYRDAFGVDLRGKGYQLRHTRRDGNCFLSSTLYYVFGDVGVRLVKLFREAICTGSIRMMQADSLPAAETEVERRLSDLAYATGLIRKDEDALNTLAARAGIAVADVTVEQREQLSAELLRERQDVLARVRVERTEEARRQTYAEYTAFFNNLRKNGEFFDYSSISVRRRAPCYSFLFTRH